MKKIVTAVCFSLMAVLTFAQEGSKKEIKKEVNVVQQNGEKVMTVKTTENGKTTTEIFKGAEADKKMKEMENETAHHQKEASKNPNKTIIVQKETVDMKDSKKSGMTKEIKVEGKDGEKHLTIKTIENGKETIETFTGEAADKKLAELENETPQPEMKKEKVIKKEIIKE
jgi:hypothetical protein